MTINHTMFTDLPFNQMDFSIYWNIIQIFVLAVSLIVIHFLKKYYHNAISSIEISKRKNKSKRLWIKLLNENSKIKEQLSEFNKLEKNDNLKGSVKWPVIIGIVYLLIYLTLLQLLSELRFEFWPSMISIFAGLNIVAFLVTIAIMSYMYRILKTPDNIYKKSRQIVISIDTTRLYILFANGLHLAITLGLYFKVKFPFSIAEDSILMNLIALPFAFSIVSYYELRLTRIDLVYFIKSVINNRIHDECPKITITSKEIEIRGNIKDIFEEEYIILNDYGHLNIIKWEDITGIYLHEQ